MKYCQLSAPRSHTNMLAVSLNPALFVHESEPKADRPRLGEIVQPPHDFVHILSAVRVFLVQAVVLFQPISSSWSSQYFDIYVLIRSMRKT